MKTIVIGAGASGLVAAIAAANAGSSVTVIEHNKQVGKKILITGNGRCNITNEAMNENKFYGDSSFIKKVLEAIHLMIYEVFLKILVYAQCRKTAIFILQVCRRRPYANF